MCILDCVDPNMHDIVSGVKLFLSYKKYVSVILK